MSTKSSSHTCGCGDATMLNEKECIQEYSKLNPKLWTLTDDMKYLVRKFKTRNFISAMNCIKEVATISELNNHHPDIHLTSWNNVEIVLWTHTVNGLTSFDFKMAKELEEIEVDYCQKWFKANLI